MKQKPEITDRIFQQSFENFAPPLTNKVWEGLQSQLLEKKARELAARKKRRFFFLLFSFLILGAISLSGFYYYNNSTQNIAAQSNSINTLNTPEENLAIPSKNDNANNFDAKKEANSEIINLNQKEALSNIETLTKQPGDSHSIQTNNNFIGENFIAKKELENKTFEEEQLDENEVLEVEEDVEIETTENFNKSLFDHSTLDLKKLGLFEIENPILPFEEIQYPDTSLLSKLSIAVWAAQSQFDRKAIDDPDVPGNPNQEAAFFNQYESSNTNWSYGFKVGLDLKKRWQLETGLGFIQYSMISQYEVSAIFQEIGPSEAILFTSFNTSNFQFNLKNTAGLETGDLISIQEKFVQKINWLSIPLMLTYKIGKERLQLNLSGGIAANLFLNSTIEIDETRANIQNFKTTFIEKAGKTNFAYRGEINLHFRANPRNSIFIGGHYQKSFTLANKQKSVKFYPSMIGWQIGLQRNF